MNLHIFMEHFSGLDITTKDGNTGQDPLVSSHMCCYWSHIHHHWSGMTGDWSPGEKRDEWASEPAAGQCIYSTCWHICENLWGNLSFKESVHHLVLHSRFLYLLYLHRRKLDNLFLQASPCVQLLLFSRNSSHI